MNKVFVAMIALAVIIVVVIIVILPREEKPAELYVDLDFPPLSPGSPVKVYANVSNMGGDARNVVIMLNSTAFSHASNKFNLNFGQSANIEITITARDVKNDYYDVNISWEYEDSEGSHTGGPITKRVYVLPLVQFVDIRWEPTFWVFSKNEIKRTDETKIYFRVESKSEMVLYSNLYCKANFTISETPVNITIEPALISVETIGPRGKSREYSFTIKARNAPPGIYEIMLYLYSSEYLVTKHTLELKVVPD